MSLALTGARIITVAFGQTCKAMVRRLDLIIFDIVISVILGLSLLLEQYISKFAPQISQIYLFFFTGRKFGPADVNEQGYYYHHNGQSVNNKYRRFVTAYDNAK
mgnify:CR=1 FL=1